MSNAINRSARVGIITDHGFKVFLDVKLHDTPATVERAARVRLGAHRGDDRVSVLNGDVVGDCCRRITLADRAGGGCHLERAA